MGKGISCADYLFFLRIIWWGGGIVVLLCLLSRALVDDCQ